MLPWHLPDSFRIVHDAIITIGSDPKIISRCHIIIVKNGQNEINLQIELENDNLQNDIKSI